jgi:hypothetical protein
LLGGDAEGAVTVSMPRTNEGRPFSCAGLCR